MENAKGRPGLDPKIHHRDVVVEAVTGHRGKMLHEAQVHGFTFFSDEPETLGARARVQMATMRACSSTASRSPC